MRVAARHAGYERSALHPGTPDAREIPLAIYALESAFSTGMGFDLVQIRGLAQRKEDENWRFRDFLKRQCDLEPEEIDRRVFDPTSTVAFCRSLCTKGIGEPGCFLPLGF
jgi:hypothetical protein